jgi:hypothetical protein
VWKVKLCDARDDNRKKERTATTTKIYKGKCSVERPRRQGREKKKGVGEGEITRAQRREQ